MHGEGSLRVGEVGAIIILMKNLIHYGLIPQGNDTFN